jgi:hypothetical protein
LAYRVTSLTAVSGGKLDAFIARRKETQEHLCLMCDRLWQDAPSACCKFAFIAGLRLAVQKVPGKDKFLPRRIDRSHARRGRVGDAACFSR